MPCSKSQTIYKYSIADTCQSIRGRVTSGPANHHGHSVTHLTIKEHIGPRPAKQKPQWAHAAAHQASQQTQDSQAGPTVQFFSFNF